MLEPCLPYTYCKLSWPWKVRLLIAHFWLNAPVVIRAKVKWCEQIPIYSYALLRIHVIGGQRSVRIAPPSLPPGGRNQLRSHWKKMEIASRTKNSLYPKQHNDWLESWQAPYSLIYELCNCYLTQKRTESSKLRVKRFWGNKCQSIKQMPFLLHHFWSKHSPHLAVSGHFRQRLRAPIRCRDQEQYNPDYHYILSYIFQSHGSPKSIYTTHGEGIKTTLWKIEIFVFEIPKVKVH